MDEVTAHFSITRINTFTVRRASRLQLAVFTLHKEQEMETVLSSSNNCKTTA